MSPAPRKTPLGQAIRLARMQQGLSLSQLSVQSGVHRSAIDRIERTGVERPNPAHLKELAQALELDAAEVFALAGMPLPGELPDFIPYLRCRYGGLSMQAITELDVLLHALAEKEGVALNRSR